MSVLVVSAATQTGELDVPALWEFEFIRLALVCVPAGNRGVAVPGGALAL